MIEFHKTSRSSYFITREGKVFSVRFGTTRELSPFIDGHGYPTVDIQRKKINLHTLVAQAFISERPQGLVINHIDGNKLNNTVENLEYVSSKENSIHAVKNGLSTHYKERKLTPKKSRAAYLLRKMGLSNVRLSLIYGVHRTHMSRVSRGLVW